MRVLTGVDLVFLPRFKESLARGGREFLQRVFLKEELENNDPAHLAGIFAAKEAAIKALSLPVDSWQEIEISKDRRGKPKAVVKTKTPQSQDLSISHDGDYVIAQFVAILKG